MAGNGQDELLGRAQLGDAFDRQNGVGGALVTLVGVDDHGVGHPRDAHLDEVGVIDVGKCLRDAEAVDVGDVGGGPHSDGVSAELHEPAQALVVFGVVAGTTSPFSSAPFYDDISTTIVILCRQEATTASSHY